MAFSEAVLREIETIADAEQIEPAALKAVVEVESGGRATSKVDGVDKPLILYEAHVFYRYPDLTDAERSEAVSRNLAARRWGDIPYKTTQSARYNQMARAAEINEQAAYAACSWGVGQVLGENASWLGYGAPKLLAEKAMESVSGQVEVMLAFIKKVPILDELRARDWRGFARRYNGSGQVDFYAGKMASAYRRHAGNSWQPGLIPAIALRMGSAGEQVAELQRKLRGLGYFLMVDGDFGPATHRMVVAFQRDQALTADGIAGPVTLGRVDALSGRAAAA